MMQGVFFLLLLVGVLSQDHGHDHDHDHHHGDGHEHVVSLDSSNFDSFVAEKPLSLVEFYAPWCTHCKRLAPEYEQAASTLFGEVPLAKVDCTKDKDLCTKHGVQGFPTLKFFRNDGSDPSDYQSGRTAPEIVKAVRKQNSPAFVAVDEAALKKLKDEEDVVVVGFFADQDAAEASGFKEVAKKLRNKVAFALANSDLASQEQASVPSVSVLRKFDEPHVKHSGDLSAEALEKLVLQESFPLFGEIGPENYQSYVERGFPILWSFLDYEDTERLVELEAVFREAAKSFRELSWVKLDGVKWSSHAKNFGLTSKLPGVVIEDRVERKKYVLPDSAEVTVETLTSHAKGFVEKTLPPTLKSQEPPPENNGPVKVVVGKTFNDVVLDESKDVFVEFYAPWCGHCKSLAPKYEELGAEFSSVPSVVIAKVDATENDIPADIHGFPTLLLYRSNDKKNPLAYNGERTAKAMSDWIRENAHTLKETAKPIVHEDL